MADLTTNRCFMSVSQAGNLLYTPTEGPMAINHVMLMAVTGIRGNLPII